MKKGKVQIVLLSGVAMAVFALAVFGVYFADHVSGKRKGLSERRRNFTANIAEGLSLRRHGSYGVDFIRCGNCRLEKQKLGGLTIGCFNVLCLDDLAVVIPDELRTRGSDGSQENSTGMSAVELARGIGIDRDFLKSRGQKLAFSGLRVTKLALSTLDAESNAVLRCVAARGEAKRDGLHLEGCGIVSGSVTNIVGTALLTVKPELKLSWLGGEMRF